MIFTIPSMLWLELTALYLELKSILTQVLGAKYLVFSPLVPSKWDKKYISFAQLLYVQLYIYYLREVRLDTFHLLNGKMVYKLSKTNIFFFRFEGTRGEKTKYFAPRKGDGPTLMSIPKNIIFQNNLTILILN